MKKDLRKGDDSKFGKAIGYARISDAIEALDKEKNPPGDEKKRVDDKQE